MSLLLGTETWRNVRWMAVWCLEASKDSRTGLQLPHCLQIVNWRTDEDLAVSSGGCSSVFDCQEPVSLSESEEDWELLNILLHFRHYTEEQDRPDNDTNSN